ncbi:hypothetical protein NPIL_163791 [Nephila pilipes]|uniref:Uncharacterized protein n=1 Tax=Nephila pilipes TaxID=299642 RepID=A0A8X6MMF9_NEPPI|nr:hypothetical protein NPIL_163791 [Nephila pilipes]
MQDDVGYSSSAPIHGIFLLKRHGGAGSVSRLLPGSFSWPAARFLSKMLCPTGWASPFAACVPHAALNTLAAHHRCLSLASGSCSKASYRVLALPCDTLLKFKFLATFSGGGALLWPGHVKVGSPL